MITQSGDLAVTLNVLLLDFLHIKIFLGPIMIEG